MTGQFHFFIIMSVIVIDIVGNWFYIEVLKKEPLHWLLWVTRGIIVGLVVYEPTIWIALLKAINGAFLYWFVFDTGLNLARHKPIDHLGKGPKAALTDRFQRWLLRDNTYYAFVIKLILSIFTAANMLYNYDPYSDF